MDELSLLGLIHNIHRLFLASISPISVSEYVSGVYYYIEDCKFCLRFPGGGGVVLRSYVY